MNFAHAEHAPPPSEPWCGWCTTTASGPSFVVLGGLVPELLCAGSGRVHAGTTDIDVQVDLEIAAASVNTARLERALANAEFIPEEGRVWRWRADGAEAGAVVKFELLTDQDDAPAGATVRFADCEQLGAANLRGTGWAARDFAPVELRAQDRGHRPPRRHPELEPGPLRADAVLAVEAFIEAVRAE